MDFYIKKDGEDVLKKSETKIEERKALICCSCTKNYIHLECLLFKNRITPHKEEMKKVFYFPWLCSKCG